MFQLNQNPKVRLEKVLEDNLYIIDDFYQNPEEIVDCLLEVSGSLSLWKENQKPHYNGIYFEDKRHSYHDPDLIPAYELLSRLCGQENLDGPDAVMTNLTRFKNSNFNDYKRCYWWPHIDQGYNGIVYLNHDDESGTNMYRPLYSHEPPDIPEHYQPWRSKHYYEVVYEIKPKFNRMVLFNGYIPHGMNICNDRYFSEDYRLNQVFFFKG